MIYKEDWQQAQERMTAWWSGEIVDRVIIHVTAPRPDTTGDDQWSNWSLVHNLTQPETVIQEFERHCRRTYFGGEAFPSLWINFGPGVMAAYIGAVARIREDTVWFETPKAWDQVFASAKFDPDNEWWKLTQEITAKVTEAAAGRFFVGITDLGGNLDIAASLRGTQDLVYDLKDHPDNVKAICQRTNQLWFRYYDRLRQIIHQKMAGTSSWMGIWSPQRWYPLQCDFAAMLSPRLFEEFALPYLAEQCRWLDHSVYHWDGPGQIPHLDLLLDVPELDGIQWTPGEGEPGCGSPKWFPLYKRIQEQGKLLVLIDRVQKDEVEQLMAELKPEGMLIRTECDSEEEARDLLQKVEKWTRAL